MMINKGGNNFRFGEAGKVVGEGGAHRGADPSTEVHSSSWDGGTLSSEAPCVSLWCDKSLGAVSWFSLSAREISFPLSNTCVFGEI